MLLCDVRKTVKSEKNQLVIDVGNVAVTINFAFLYLFWTYL